MQIKDMVNSSYKGQICEVAGSELRLFNEMKETYIPHYRLKIPISRRNHFSFLWLPAYQLTEVQPSKQKKEVENEGLF